MLEPPAAGRKKRIDRLLSTMTIHKKIGQTLCPDAWSFGAIANSKTIGGIIDSVLEKVEACHLGCLVVPFGTSAATVGDSVVSRFESGTSPWSCAVQGTGAGGSTSSTDSGHTGAGCELVTAIAREATLTRMFGSHLSIAGGLHNALIEAKRLGMDCVQVFTKNQQQWAAPPLTDEKIALWKQHQRDTGITEVVSHDSYLINLASPKREVREKSISLFIDEVERCEALGIAWLVTHPGAHLGLGEAKGLQRVAAALDRVHKRLVGYRTITCLEITAGQGSGLGYQFEHLRRIIDMTGEPERLAVCFDTAHALEAGYDLTSGRGMRQTLERFDEVLGLDLLKVVHVNDSKTPRSSHVDRHTHIGHGHVALAAFRELVNHAKLARVPKILETPKEDAPDGRAWDTINVTLLRGMVRRKGE